MGTRKFCYMAALRRWGKFLWTEPDALLAGCLWFLLTALPIVTAGPAWLALAAYMAAREEGRRMSWRAACALAFCRGGWRGFAMGLGDCLVLLLAGGCALGALAADLPLALRGLYGLMLALNCLYLCSGLYRYPALARQPKGPVPALAARGFLMFLHSLGWSLLFVCAQLLALMVCAATGAGLLFLWPAASAALGGCAYDEMRKAYGGQ
jgi:hypothetical protein